MAFNNKMQGKEVRLIINLQTSQNLCLKLRNKDQPNGLIVATQLGRVIAATFVKIILMKATIVILLQHAVVVGAAIAVAVLVVEAVVVEEALAAAVAVLVVVVVILVSVAVAAAVEDAKHKPLF